VTATHPSATVSCHAVGWQNRWQKEIHVRWLTMNKWPPFLAASVADRVTQKVRRTDLPAALASLYFSVLERIKKQESEPEFEMWRKLGKG
jgi:hypothetical protein